MGMKTKDLVVVEGGFALDAVCRDGGEAPADAYYTGTGSREGTGGGCGFSGAGGLGWGSST